MSTLITGAAGFIGSHLAERLVAQGEGVVGMDNFDPLYSRRAKEQNLAGLMEAPGFVFEEGDIRDRDVLSRLPGQVDSVIHLAALPGVRPSILDPVRYSDVNLVGTAAILEFARERGVEALVFGSSSSVFGAGARVPFAEDDPLARPISPYAATKLGGEHLCRVATHLHGVSCICLRYFTVYGPRQRPDLAIHHFTRLLGRGEELPLFGDGSSRRDYTFVDDIVEGTLAALNLARDRGGRFEIVNLGSGRTVSLLEMVEEISGALGVEPRIRWLPPQPGDVPVTLADISKARKLLGYEPSTPFAEGIRRFLEWVDRVGLAE